MRPPPSAEDEVGWQLYSLTGELLPSFSDELEIERLRNTLRAIKAMGKVEAQTRANIHKFIHYLQTNGFTIFGPTRIYLGGFYDFLRRDELDVLKRRFLRTRESPCEDIDAEIYELAPEYKTKIGCPEAFIEAWNQYERTHNLKSPFQDHDKNQVHPLITNLDNYIGYNRNLFEQARHDKLDLEVEMVKDEISYDEPIKIRKTNQVYRPFVASVYHLLTEYKHIHRKSARRNKSAEFQKSRRIFAPSFAHKQVRNGKDIERELAFHTGVPEIESLYSGFERFHLWETLKQQHGIKIEFDGRLDIEGSALAESAVGVFGFFQMKDEGLVLKSFALVKIGDLPDIVIQERRASLNYGVRSDLAQIQQTVSKLENKIGSLGQEDKNLARELIKRLDQATTVADAIDYALTFKQEHPELEFLAQIAINNLK
jgi:hypothetical protein